MRLNGKLSDTASADAPGSDDTFGLDSRQVFLTLHTHVGERLVTGRPADSGKSAIIGLFGFADRLRTIWQCAVAGNPYARWSLLKVELAEDRARGQIEAEWQFLEDYPNATTPLILGNAKTLQRLQLQFACPYAYRAAFLLKQLDELADAVTLGARIGIAPKSQLLPARYRAERAMRHLFASVQSFHPLDIQSQDVVAGNEQARLAETLMGPIPDAVLHGIKWPQLLDEPYPGSEVQGP